ncbi:zinc finger BED domain-containing protein RICESLEEPER 2 [Tanacetum coccineum]
MDQPQGHFKRECPKLKNNNNRGNQGRNGNAPAKVYAVGRAGTNPDSNVVTGTFLLNNRYDSVLFNTGTDRSFVSTAFSSQIDITPSSLDHYYDVKLADGRIIGLNTILRGCTLNFLNHPFNIDLMLVELGSFDAIIGIRDEHLDPNPRTVPKRYRIPACNGRFVFPSRHKLSRDVEKYYLDERNKLLAYLTKPTTTVHLTTDTWTSSCKKNYMVVTAHFIDNEWNMHKQIINFRPIDSHKAEDISSDLLKCIVGWGIKNVLTMTVDNAPSNDKALDHLIKSLPNAKIYDEGKHFHIICMAHILNLIVKEGLKEKNYHVDCVANAVKYIRKYNKYWGKFDELNDYMYFATILDSTMKQRLVSHGFKKILEYNMSSESPLPDDSLNTMVREMLKEVVNRMRVLFQTYKTRFDMVVSKSSSKKTEESTTL